MKNLDEIALANRRLWEKEVEQGGGYTVPWLDLDVAELQSYARGDLATLPEPLTCLYPDHIFDDVSGREVLCLASGGGQQSAVFGLLGARVTVADLTEGQLAGDRRAAAHYGYDVATVQCDMRDMSSLKEASFDLVYQANSTAYIPDIRVLYSGVHRVLKPGGRYRVCLSQPAVHHMTWNGKTYCIAEPYAGKVHRRDDGGIEFRHYMDEIFNGLIEYALSIRSVHEAPYAHLPHYQKVTPGTWNHERAFVAGEFVIIAEK